MQALTRSIFLALGLLALAFGESVHEVEFTVRTARAAERLIRIELGRLTWAEEDKQTL